MVRVNGLKLIEDIKDNIFNCEIEVFNFYYYFNLLVLRSLIVVLLRYII